MKDTLLLTLLLLFAIGAFAQNSPASSNGQSGGYYTFGINVGAAYQSSDVSAEVFAGNGWGLTLAKNLYYRPGAPLSFDLRGRFLTTKQVGLDGTPSTLIGDNPALNGTLMADYLNYPVGLNVNEGFAFYNHETRTAELALEAVIELNRLREQTNWIISLYGGIGLDWYRTKINALGTNNAPYYSEFAALNTTESESRIRRQLRNDILDDSYESTAAGFTDNKGKLGFMPSLGLDIGYQISPVVSFHLGHRVTFSGTDILDGNSFDNPNKDIYHYTSASLRFRIDPARRSRPIARGPDIRITSPDVLPFYSNSRRNRVRAEITNISSAADVNCTFNGRSIGFDYETGRFSRELVLENGRNILVITAQNQAGSDREEVILFFTPDDIPTPIGRAPQVTFTRPNRDPFQTASAQADIEASILHVNSAEDIDFFVNGRQQNFNFDASRDRLQANINLQTGENSVLIRARNRLGTDEAETIIIRERKPDGPTVNIQNPRDGDRTENSFTQLRTRLTGVSSRDQVELRVNGQLNRSFSFNQGFTELNAELDLRLGENRIAVQVRTPNGAAQDEVRITRERDDPPVIITSNPPKVRIIDPANNSSTDQATIDLVANLDYISSSRQIDLRVNGTRERDFAFRNGRLRVNVDLRAGNNTIRLIATNEYGKDEDGINVRYQPPASPTVKIERPTDGSTLEDARQSFEARTRQVEGRDQIELLLNGSRISNFNFDSRSGRITTNLNLREGTNTMQVKVNTAGGQDTDRATVTYRRLVAPTVNITKPSNGSTFDRASQSFEARTQSVESRDQIECLLNGNRISNFNFDSGQGRITTTLNLREGGNTIEVKVRTSGGQDTDRSTVTYQRLVPPTVNITKPSNGSIFKVARQSFEANTAAVESSGQIELLLNGSRISDFSFDTRSGRIQANVSLREGKNTIKVQVRTDGGTDSDQTIVTYAPTPAPTVSFTNPNRNDTRTTNPRQSFTAELKNVARQDQITLSFNNKNVKDFRFEPRTGRLSFQSNLQLGKNSASISVQTDGGQANASVNIIYNKREVAPRKPTVEITSISRPVTDPTNPNPNPTSTILAKLSNVSKASQITFVVNGNTITAFNYNTRTGAFSATVNMVRGDNTVLIRAVTPTGEAEDSREVGF